MHDSSPSSCLLVGSDLQVHLSHPLMPSHTLLPSCFSPAPTGDEPDPPADRAPAAAAASPGAGAAAAAQGTAVMEGDGAQPAAQEGLAAALWCRAQPSSQPASHVLVAAPSSGGGSLAREKILQLMCCQAHHEHVYTSDLLHDPSQASACTTVRKQTGPGRLPLRCGASA